MFSSISTTDYYISIIVILHLRYCMLKYSKFGLEERIKQLEGGRLVRISLWFYMSIRIHGKQMNILKLIIR